MKLVIDIPEDLYKEKIRGTTSNRQDRKILECVKNGTPLEEELEKIREELKDSVYLHRDFVFGVINKHIAELKGENNE